jgi:hypothetical protein
VYSCRQRAPKRLRRANPQAVNEPLREKLKLEVARYSAGSDFFVGRFAVVFFAAFGFAALAGFSASGSVSTA